MVAGGTGFVKPMVGQFLVAGYRYISMTFLLWIVAVVLVVWGVVLLIDGVVVLGILLTVVGLFLGASGGYGSRRM